MQYGWLELDAGIWRLLTGNAADSPWAWVDKDAALASLAQEGWLISGPFPELYAGGDPRSRFFGYALTRVVQCRVRSPSLTVPN